MAIPPPQDGQNNIYTVLVDDEWDEDTRLRSDSLISHADALNKAFWYSSLYNVHLTPASDDPLEGSNTQQVPYVFEYYPASLTEDPSLTIQSFQVIVQSS